MSEVPQDAFSDDSIKLIGLIFVILHIFLWFISTKTFWTSIGIARNVGWLRLLEYLWIVEPVLIRHAVILLEQIFAISAHRWNWLGEMSPLLHLLTELGSPHHIWIHEIGSTWLVSHRHLVREEIATLRIHLFLHLQRTLHLEILTIRIHAMRATHDAAYLHPAGVRLHLILVLLSLPHIHQSVWIEILCVLLRL